MRHITKLKRQEHFHKQPGFLEKERLQKKVQPNHPEGKDQKADEKFTYC